MTPEDTTSTPLDNRDPKSGTETLNKRSRVVLLGAGSLGRAFLRLLRDQTPRLDLVAVVTARHGRIAADGPSGVLDPGSVLSKLESEGLGETAPSDLRKLFDNVRPHILVECIPQNIRTGEPALSFHRLALDVGVNVVTANKAPVALGYKDLNHRAARTNKGFRFEATMLDGLPVFHWIQHLCAVRNESVSCVRGVLNGTSSLVLESVQLGSTRSRGLARAQALGIAEADSILDLDGWDAASKLVLLSSVWMGSNLRIVDVERRGCDAVKDEDIRRAASLGARYRLVATAKKQPDGSIKAGVEPVALEPLDPLYPVKGANGGLTVQMASGFSVTLLQHSSGLDDAASALLSDCLAFQQNSSTGAAA